ncbi:hypothetical protein F7230_02645 [Corynebacterium sp. 320]|uniref:LGFP repeat-containing protein n=1 Tax=Corynebacterium zhongnanshanii TaxID=2768834 RepID=A0ABQ6VFT3_9CORY|nr:MULTISPECIES: hypothetical protein [Corynebacterium]KAB1504020.1 hypothetical protein F7230_02645 [Corynebacterium sp. 320]KAB1552881.1 hypothetical protein F7233_03950 [Corynebacterium sp. 321]KAB1553901.1 hypothetical protein F7232_02635 [Corynebacterium sp. 319]KAB3523130.1 hypothetical protein F8377_03000 [Corynebacterium zhongnanshanii]KAB3528156.1 hypothetical protein F8354_02645 [Corynebacterium sp. 250]
MFTSMSRKAAAVAAGTMLLVGAAACSDNNDSVEDKANEATAAAGSAVDDAKDKANDAKDGAQDKASEASDAMTSENADELPEETKTVWENEGGAEGPWGDVKSSESNDNGDVLTTFDSGNVIVYSKDNGAVPVIGKIAETWINGGGLDNEVGLPTAPEKGDAASGWTQSFTKGHIEWSKQDDGKYSDTVVKH